ncbi:hypothetical protein B5F89_05120, partial [Collinsella sp. An307]
MSWGNGFPTQLGAGREPFKSLLGSERCILVSAGGLSAGDPPSLGGDAAGATLSVNALVSMLAHALFLRSRGPRTKSWTARRSGREVRMHSREDVELALMALEEGW